MKLEKVIYKTPEISDTNLLEVINEHKHLLNANSWSKGKYKTAKAILDEYDLIQQKKSNLTKSQREEINGFVGLCMINMVKGGSK